MAAHKSMGDVMDAVSIIYTVYGQYYLDYNWKLWCLWYQNLVPTAYRFCTHMQKLFIENQFDVTCKEKFTSKVFEDTV